MSFGRGSASVLDVSGPIWGLLLVLPVLESLLDIIVEVRLSESCVESGLSGLIAMSGQWKRVLVGMA